MKKKMDLEIYYQAKIMRTKCDGASYCLVSNLKTLTPPKSSPPERIITLSPP